MPAWWGKKSSKGKEESPHSNSLDSSKSWVRNDKKKVKDKPNKSFDDVSASILSRTSLRNSRELANLAGGSSGFSGFDSDGVEKRGHPLPQPSLSPAQSLGNEIGVVGCGSGSVSVSSVSSSSSEEPVIASFQGQFGGYSGHGDSKFNTGSRSPGPGSRSPGPCSRSPGPGSRSPGPGSRSPGPGSRSPGPGSRSPGPGSRSPGPGSRAATTPTSPLHPRLGGMSLDSPGKQEDGKSQCHRLPLPPGSPSSPSTLAKTTGATGSTPCVPSKWKRGKLLGRGTFGHVYLGFNSESGQMCAIKEVRVVSDDQTSRECLKQLNQEINLLSQLSHPNIVQYYGSELGEETLSVYLEYVSAGSIFKLLQEYGPFKEAVIQNYTRQIISGLAYLHGRNTVHRDIKGANILVDPNGEIKLADFGMAKHITSCSSMLSFKGSPYWMAPEVVMNTNGYSLAVDIWSLGCTILEMATSKPPWSQYEGVAAIFKIGNSRDIPEIPDHLSIDAKSFVKLCLQRDPSARPTALQLLDHPFIQDQLTTRVANVNITREAFPYTFDGSRTPTALELHPNRTSINSCDGDYATKSVITTSRALKNPRDNVRMITSLPVSPCSSPLRQLGPAHRSCYLSPPHPAFVLAGQSAYNLNDHSVYPMRPYTLDPWQETSLFKSQTPGTSPRTRPL